MSSEIAKRYFVSVPPDFLDGETQDGNEIAMPIHDGEIDISEYISSHRFNVERFNLTNNLFELINNEFFQKNITFRQRIYEETRDQVETDYELLQHVIKSMLHNAFDRASEKPVTVSIEQQKLTGLFTIKTQDDLPIKIVISDFGEVLSDEFVQALNTSWIPDNHITASESEYRYEYRAYVAKRCAYAIGAIVEWNSSEKFGTTVTISMPQYID